MLSAGKCVPSGRIHALAPVLDIARDPRWGRMEETYGEDPYLVSQIGAAYVKEYSGRPQIRCYRHSEAFCWLWFATGRDELGSDFYPGT